MTRAWKLERTAQCKACPWRVGVDPWTAIPTYDHAKHVALANTVAAPDLDVEGTVDHMNAVLSGAKPMHVMTCHETDAAHCIGWLANQLGDGNNLLLRLQVMSCTNVHRLRLRGPQHPDFASTVPADPPPPPR